MGKGDDGLRLVREGLTLALDNGLTTAAAELFQRLADSLEHAGRLRPGANGLPRGRRLLPDAFDRIHGAAVPRLHVGGALADGSMDEAERTSREVIGSTDATEHAHAVAEGILGIVAALRGSTGRARPHLEASLQTARRIELTAMEFISSWGLAVCDRLEGDQAGAVDRCRRLLARWERTEERHYVVPALRWGAIGIRRAGRHTGGPGMR